MKTHLNLATTDLDKSIEFYSVLLDAKPAKTRFDYALFITDNPGLELALNATETVAATSDGHFGVLVETAEQVHDAVTRFERAALPVSVEREVTCCYANQTKVWATDPEGRRWEIYTVHKEADDSAEAVASACCSA